MTKKKFDPQLAERQYRKQVFKDLRGLWCQAEEGRTFQDLAAKLGVASQRVSSWASLDPSYTPPPWSVLLTLLDELELSILIGSKACRIVKA